MAQTKLGENTVNTTADLPAIGSSTPDFKLVKTDLTVTSLRDFAGKNIIFNIFPSIDTRTCATSVREFNKLASSLKDTVVLCVSKDLPFANRRFCGAEGIQNVLTLSDFRNLGFAKDYGVEMIEGAMVGLFARTIVIADKNGKIIYTEMVPTIGQEPDYDAAIKALQ